MGKPVIDIRDLSKFYGKTRGIEHLNLSVDEGEIFGFIGPNGAGKSTTIRILMNLIFPTRGEARIMGMDVTGKTMEIMQITGYIPSEAYAYSSMTVSEFLGYCGRFYRLPGIESRTKELSGIFGLELKKKIGDLSSGNRKKVSIVQSLIHKPRLLIMDEPTTGLDPLMQSVFFDLLESENRRGMTIFFSSHILGEVQMFCRKVAIIREGKIIQTEDVENLRKKQLKKVQIELSDKSDMTSVNLEGISGLTFGSGNSLSFSYSGDINELTGFLSSQKINNLVIEEPSLEEIFMHFYKI